MENTKYTTLLSPWLLLVIGMVLFVFSNGHWIVPLAAWIAPVFLLRYVRNKKAPQGLAILLVLMTLASGIMLFGIIPGALGFLTYVLIFYYALLWWLPYLADKLIASRLSGFHSTLVFPLAMVSVEFINTSFFGSWAATAYTQFDHLTLMQVSSLTGIWGITFIIFWLAAVANWTLENQTNTQKIRKGIGIYTLVLVSVLFYGGLRLAVFPPISKTVNVVSFTPQQQLDSYFMDLTNKGFSSSVNMAKTARDSLSAMLDQVHEAMFKRNDEIMGPDTGICVWPEGTISVLAENEAAFIQRGKDLAQKHNSYLLLGFMLIPEQNPAILRENKAVLINPNGQVVIEFLKANATPGATDLEGPVALQVVDSRFGKLSTAICYDMDFTRFIHQAGQQNVDIMLVPAWDWKDIDPLHSRMAAFRAIENGFSMVRQTGNGLSIAVDHQGRTLASMDHFTTTDFTMVSQVPTKGVNTLYAFTGDLFAWISIFMLLVLSFLGFYRET